MSYYEASRVVDRMGIRNAGPPREKLYESPWTEGQEMRADNPPRVLSYQAAARNVFQQRETIYEANWMLWERIRSYPSRAWVQMLKFQDRWLLLVTDEDGRNYRECAGEEDCYRTIEATFPAVAGMGCRSDGVIEIQAATAAAI